MAIPDFVANSSRWRMALLILGSAAFVAIGLWMIGMFGEVPETRRYSATSTFAIGWACILFFGLCGLAGLRGIFTSGEELRISSSGIRWNRWSDQTIPWSEIKQVTEWKYRSNRSIVLHLRDPARFPGKGIPAWTAKANRVLTGGDIAFSLTTMDRSFDDAMTAIALFGNSGRS